MTFPPEALRAAIAHCEAAYPNEGCGVFVRTDDGTLCARPMTNAVAAERAHAAYALDPRELLAVLSSPESLACVFHSHVDAAAHFSEEDRRGALVDGEPILPGVSHQVIAVRKHAEELALYTWSGAAFEKSSIDLP